MGDRFPYYHPDLFKPKKKKARKLETPRLLIPNAGLGKKDMQVNASDAPRPNSKFRAKPSVRKKNLLIARRRQNPPKVAKRINAEMDIFLKILEKRKMRE